MTIALTGLLLAPLLAGQGDKPQAPAAAPPVVTPAVEAETLERASGALLLTADYYAPKATAKGPMIVALHMEGSSRGEYAKSAAEFVLFGCTVLAVDLRAGKEHAGVVNKTAAAYSAKNGKPATLAESYDDIAEAVKWARELRPEAKLLLLGSSSSATLALAYAARVPAGVDAVIAISPSESIEGWSVAAEVRNIKVPTLVMCGSEPEERPKATRFFNGIDKKLRASFFPPPELALPHGAPLLWSDDETVRHRVWSPVHKALAPLHLAADADK
ncbi:MAG: alpha/beta hydrolase [Planctomycetes bacterium]|nr:alpha/beta hydrolase [Planctomycetota bacterium]